MSIVRLMPSSINCPHSYNKKAPHIHTSLYLFVSDLFRMRFVDLLHLLLLVQSLFCASASSMDMSSPPPPLPWWEAPHLTYTPVDPDYSWENRRTGVTDYWKAGLSIWSHYNRTALEKVAHKQTTRACCAPIPWTSGRMLKCLHQINETAFELHSVYEPSAVGDWFNKGRGMTTRPQDGLMEHGHVFYKTPYRVSKLPTQLPEHWPEAASTSRVTIVQPDAATVSCPRWLPDDEQQSDELLRGNYERWEFAELWLAETLMSDNTNSNDGDGETHQSHPEAVKVGLFCQYNGVTGELMQVFRMREIALPGDLNPDRHPAQESFDLAQLQTTLEERQWPAWTDRAHLDPSSSPAARELASGAPVALMLKQAGWTRMSGRVVRTESPDGPEVACTVHNTAATDADLLDYADPICPEDQELYWDVRCSDGKFLNQQPNRRIPNLPSAHVLSPPLTLQAFIFESPRRFIPRICPRVCVWNLVV
jgi:hypothetical protein